MLDWFNFNNFGGFFYIVFLMVGIKVLITYIEKARNGDCDEEDNDVDTESWNSNIGDSEESDKWNSSYGPCDDKESDKKAIRIKIKTEDLKRAIVALRRLDRTMCD